MSMQVPADFEAKIDAVILRYPVSKRSASLPLLHLWQERFGYISPYAIEWIAAKLELEPINILELVTFYPMFRQKPVGTCHIRVCRTLSCAMAGGYGLMKQLCEKTGIERPDHPDHHDPIAVSSNGKWSIEFVECLASCGTGPVCMVNDDFHEAVSPEKIGELVAHYEEK